MQSRAQRPTPGRHRQELLHRHRAPRTPLVLPDRSRGAVLTAALVAGVGVAGVSAVTAHATPSRADASAEARTAAAAQTPMTMPDRNPSATAADAAIGSADAVEVLIPPAALSYVRTQRKTRPVAVLPVAQQWVNPLPEARVTSCFGERWGRLHAGVDLAAPDGTRIRAAGAGVVVAAGEAEGYGNAVLIDHGNGFLTHYGHMSAIVVKVGQKVAVGEQIGNEGSTGHSTGPHLHFEVHQGSYKNPIEPTQWMHEHGVDIPGCVPLTD